jgi:hypothetical protein
VIAQAHFIGNFISFPAEMPLIVLTGIPASGKTRRANDLMAHFTTMNNENVNVKSVVVLDDALLKFEKTVYACTFILLNPHSFPKRQMKRKRHAGHCWRQWSDI